jgi:hypothetical protein
MTRVEEEEDYDGGWNGSSRRENTNSWLEQQFSVGSEEGNGDGDENNNVEKNGVEGENGAEDEEDEYEDEDEDDEIQLIVQGRRDMSLKRNFFLTTKYKLNKIVKGIKERD